MRNIALIIEYDGTAFHGWQMQPGYRTVEAEIQKALEAVTYKPVKLFAASRTDAGVHARGQVAHFQTESTFPPARLLANIAQILPEDIAILNIQERPENFHARHDAQGKWYRYMVFTRETPPAIERNFVMAMREKLHLAPMVAAAKMLTGTHDFVSFGVNSGTEPESTVKTIYRLDVHKDGDKIFFDIVGDSFLYRMVRSLVGTLLDIGQGKRKPESIAAVLEKKNRCAAGPTVPSQGLCLMKVFYENPAGFILPA